MTSSELCAVLEDSHKVCVSCLKLLAFLCYHPKGAITGQGRMEGEEHRAEEGSDVKEQDASPGGMGEQKLEGEV